jgi:hypothetical protein
VLIPEVDKLNYRLWFEILMAAKMSIVIYKSNREYQSS